MTSPESWRCDAHDVRTSGDCPRCDAELIKLTEDEWTGPRCCRCGRALLTGETAWAADWSVIGADGARTETRYTCDECAA